MHLKRSYSVVTHNFSRLHTILPTTSRHAILHPLLSNTITQYKIRATANRPNKNQQLPPWLHFIGEEVDIVLHNIQSVRLSDVFPLPFMNEITMHLPGTDHAEYRP